MGVKRFQRMWAYSTLRRSDFLGEEEKARLDVAHAEGGLVVMTAEGLFLAAWYGWAYPDKTQVDYRVFLFLAVAFLVASYPGAWEQHSLECISWRTREKDVQRTLETFGILPSTVSGT